MDYRIVERDAFVVVGRSSRISCADNAHHRQISDLWEACHRDGTVERLGAIGKDGTLFGIVVDTQPGEEMLTYMIAGEVDAAAGAGAYERRTIPASAWAVFDSVGPMPGAIQELFRRIYQEWFPAAGYEHSGAPEMEVYPPGDTTAENYRCEVWVPVAKRSFY